jgi:hypothetical protein
MPESASKCKVQRAQCMLGIASPMFHASSQCECSEFSHLASAGALFVAKKIQNPDFQLFHRITKPLSIKGCAVSKLCYEQGNSVFTLEGVCEICKLLKSLFDLSNREKEL